MAVTPKKRQFAKEYLVDLNATQAAVRTGYSERTARAQGQRLLTDPDVQTLLQAEQKARSERTEITADLVLAEVAAMGVYNASEIGALCKELGIAGPGDLGKLPLRLQKAIVGWSWDRNNNFTLKFADRLKGLELLGRHLGLFNDKLNVSGALAVRSMTDEELNAALAQELAALAAAKPTGGA